MRRYVAALIYVAIMALAACHSSASSPSEQATNGASTSLGSEFLGTWSQQRRNDSLRSNFVQYIDITKQDSMFLLNFHATAADFAGGQSGTYPATLQNGMLHPVTPELGDIVYIRSSDTILVSGSAFSRAGATLPGL